MELEARFAACADRSADRDQFPDRLRHFETYILGIEAGPCRELGAVRISAAADEVAADDDGWQLITARAIKDRLDGGILDEASRLLREIEPLNLYAPGPEPFEVAGKSGELRINIGAANTGRAAQLLARRLLQKISLIKTSSRACSGMVLGRTARLQRAASPGVALLGWPQCCGRPKTVTELTGVNSPGIAHANKDAMCELLGLSSNAPATVSFSLPKLAEHGAASGTYNDGWGIGYYEGQDVRLIKDAGPVGNSDWVRFIANHELRSMLIVAHARRATRGTRSYQNAQPFIRELAGRVHLFAHNGDLPGIFSVVRLPTQSVQSDRGYGL